MNARTFDLLRMLADGEFQSGAVMARKLGVSRASVCNALRGLREVGLDVFSVRGRGYRLAQPLSLLDASAIVRELGAHARRFAVEVLDCTESTNTLLLERMAAGAPGGSVIAAEWQTHGRGRRGRLWHAMPGAALTFSLLWRLERGAGFLAGLSLAAGVAVVRVLAALGVRDAGLKWPNDIWWRERKLGGILIEMNGDTLGPSAAVIGIGLNMRLPEVLRRRIDQPAADLETACGAAPDRNRVLALLLIELSRVLDICAQSGFAPLREEWQSHHVFHHKAVRFALPDGNVVCGVAQGVADDGALVLATDGGSRQLHNGEISLSSGGRAARGPNPGDGSGA